MTPMLKKISSLQYIQDDIMKKNVICNPL